MKNSLKIILTLMLVALALIFFVKKGDSSDKNKTEIDSLVQSNKKLSLEIERSYEKIKAIEDSLKNDYKLKTINNKIVYVKKIDNLRFISIDSSIIILSNTLSKESRKWE